jgi:hypothetical protein
MKLIDKIKKMSTIDILIAIVAVYAMYMLYHCYSQKERMWASEPAPVPQAETSQPNSPMHKLPVIENACGDGAFVASNLLPKADAKMVEEGFEFAPKDLQGVNFLTAEQKIGIDTVANSLRNANYNLREEPANPKTVVSIWNQSTIGNDLTRRPLN